MIHPLKRTQLAFTIVDDTDNSTLETIRPLYDLLTELGMRTTKTVWVYPPRDSFTGSTLADPEYVRYLLDLQDKGFEIALHNVGSGAFSRDEILSGLDRFAEVFGHNPTLLVNHGWNPDCLYWGAKRFCGPVGRIFRMLRDPGNYGGEVEGSLHFWGDRAKEVIRYVRNHTFDEPDLARRDRHMPYHDPTKPYVNRWFSSADARDLEQLVDVLSWENLARLVEDHGVCILYTHCADGLTSNGQVHPQLRRRLEYLASKGGHFVPATQLLDELGAADPDSEVGWGHLLRLDAEWVFDHLRIALRRRMRHRPTIARILSAVILATLPACATAQPSTAATVRLDIEAGGGRTSPRAIQYNQAGYVDAVLTPMWERLGGREYGAEGTAAISARMETPLGSRARIAVGGRTFALREEGSVSERTGTLEAASVRLDLGRVVLAAGRDWVRLGPDERGLFLSDNAPPLDYVALLPHGWVPVPLLGRLSATALVADLGPRQTPNHTKLFAVRVEARPSSSVTIGFTSMNKQGGDGAPDATLSDRLKDLSIVWDVFAGDGERRFSDKSIGADVSVTLANRVRLIAEAALGDFDADRVGDVIDAGGALRVRLDADSLGAQGRHAVSMEATRIGPTLYRHHQFTSGLTKDQTLLGSPLGPDARGIELAYRYGIPIAGLRPGVSLQWAERSGDEYSVTADPVKDIFRSVDGLDERRVGVQLLLARALGSAGSGVELRLQAVRVVNPALVAGRATDAAALVRAWWTWSD